MQGLESLLIGFLAGIIMGGGGYYKARQVEPFDDYRFAASVLLGALSGVTAWMIGAPMESLTDKAMMFGISSGFAVQTEIWAKVFRRRTKK